MNNRVANIYMGNKAEGEHLKGDRHRSACFPLSVSVPSPSIHPLACNGMLYQQQTYTPTSSVRAAELLKEGNNEACHSVCLCVRCSASSALYRQEGKCCMKGIKSLRKTHRGRDLYSGQSYPVIPSAVNGGSSVPSCLNVCDMHLLTSAHKGWTALNHQRL